MSLLDSLFGGGQAQMPGQASQPSGLQRLLQPEIALPMAAALMGNQGNMQNLGNAFAQGGQALVAQKAGMQDQAAENKTYQWLQQNAPEFAQLMDGGMDGKSALAEYTKQRYAQTKNPDAVQVYEYAKQQGYGGSFMDFQIDQKKAGAPQNNITVGGGKFGTIPQGWMLNEGPDGVTMAPIPGGPEDTSKKDARQSGQNDVATRVVTSAAQRAREAAGNRAFGEVGQGLVEKMPWTDSAEVARQVEVLKSTAKVENLNAMRQSSPTGGALGSVTKEETDMLAAKSGALNQNSPNFQRDLDDYELTLLQVVHGPQEGERIFRETRQGGGAAQQGNSTSSGVTWKVLP